MKEYIIRVANDGSYRIYNSYMGRQTTEIPIHSSILGVTLTAVLCRIDTLPPVGSVDYDYDAEEVTNDSYPDGIIVDEFINPDGSFI